MIVETSQNRLRQMRDEAIGQIIAQTPERAGAVLPGEAEGGHRRLAIGDQRIAEGDVGNTELFGDRGAGPVDLIDEQRIDPIICQQIWHLAQTNVGGLFEDGDGILQRLTSAELRESAILLRHPLHGKFIGCVCSTDKSSGFQPGLRIGPLIEADAMPPRHQFPRQCRLWIQMPREFRADYAEMRHENGYSQREIHRQIWHMPTKVTSIHCARIGAMG